MSGLFGLINTHTTVDTQAFLDTCARRLSHRPWYIHETWLAPDCPVGIGRTGIGIFNREPQPVRQGGCLAWLSGEFTQTQELHHKLKRGDPAFRFTDPELALAAYHEFGLDFAGHLRGDFFVAIYDSAARRLVLANDRFGLYPHYYAVSPRQLVFAPEVKGVLCAPGMERKPDITAASQYFRFQQVLGERTFHEGISLFPYGSTAVYDLDSGDWSVRRYWEWDQLPERPNITFEEAVEEVGDRLQNAVVRLSDSARPGVFLSGGLDSRALLGLMPPADRPPVTATFGYPTSRDVVYANQIARAMRSEHYWFDLPDGQWVPQYVDFHLQLTEGFHSWLHMHGITMLDSLRGVMDVNLTGWDGGTVMGHLDHINEIYNSPVDEWTVALRTYHQFINSYTWPGLADSEERLLFTPQYGRQVYGLALESMLAEFSRFWKYRPVYAAEYFYVVNHCWRSTGNMVKTMRSAMEVRFPFWDYDLIDFMYSLPPHIRRDQLLYRTIITRRMPRLAYIPYDKQEYLPTVQKLPHAAQKTAVRLLKRLKLFPQHPTLYADYEKYLRSELRGWAEDILFSPRTAQRGIFNMDFVRSLMDRHLAGHEPWTIGKIAPLITYEMVMREYFD
ncbi:MAG TPA: asparagine synthase-related protein [Anaerolineaceae bacterium]